MQAAVKKALDSFAYNRKEAEKMVAVLEKEIGDIEKALVNSAGQSWWKVRIHYHRRIAKKALRERKAELDFRQLNIEKYLKAENGLCEGNYESAIAILGEISANLKSQESPFLPMLFGPGAMGRQMADLRDELILLQKQGA
jgi:hypothetical protein